jgi:hypothetical protein
MHIVQEANIVVCGTNERLRRATAEERLHSKQCALYDGGIGIICLKINGKETNCYVEEK